jgi:hypothetical protein
MSTYEADRNADSTTAGANLLLFVCWSWATSVEVFLHKNFGSRYLGFQALAVFFLVPFFGLAFEQYDLVPLVLFLPAYFLMLVIARIGVLRRRWRGEECHSMYTGWPRLLKPTDKIPELKAKRLIEPLIVSGLGFILTQVGEVPLGAYLVGAGICLAITVNIDLSLAQMRAQRMHDAVIEQRQLASRFREMQGQF